MAVWLILSAAAYGLARVALPGGLGLLADGGLVRRNYRGEAVPAGAGIFIVLVYATVLSAASAAALARPAAFPVTLLFVTVAMGFVGFVDDVLGDKTVQGLRGHMGLLLRGRLSTGGLKAVFGGVTGLGAAAVLRDGAAGLLLGALVIALASNAVNLLDLRPGRAVKGAALLAAALAGVSPDRQAWLYTLPLWGALAAYAPYDLRARAMMGDAGANAVGAAVGAAAAAALSLRGLGAAAAFLVLLHVWAERGSISAAIERVPLLRRLDELGRR